MVRVRFIAYKTEKVRQSLGFLVLLVLSFVLFCLRIGVFGGKKPLGSILVQAYVKRVFGFELNGFGFGNGFVGG